MSDSLLDFCKEYRARDEVKQFESDYFFPARDHGYYKKRPDLFYEIYSALAVHFGVDIDSERQGYENTIYY